MSPERDHAVAAPRGGAVVLALTLLLLLASWSLIDGYQLADSVEYMEHAQALVRGAEVVDSTDIRSYGFVSLLAPIFLVADWIGVEDFKPIVALVRVLQILLGLELVRQCMRIGARVAGERAGLLAGCAVGFNPVFLQYAVSPVSGVAAAVCVAHAVPLLIDRGRPRRSLAAGLWLGGALLMAYQTILVSAALGVAVLLRDRWKHRMQWIALGAGLGAGVLTAGTLDLVAYGAWGKGLMTYFGQNFFLILARIPNELGMTQLARNIWGMGAQYFEAESGGHRSSTDADVRQKQTVFFYVVNLPRMVVWPFLAVFLPGLVLAATRRRRQREGVLLVAFLLCVVVMSYKGSKDFRLWLPLLPLVAVFAALGFRGLLGPLDARARAPRAALGLALVALGAVFGWARLAERDTARFSAYWDAVRVVDELAQERGRELRTASAWHWAAYLRPGSDVELVKLPHQLDRWPVAGEERASDLDAQERADDLAAIADLDAFVTHLGVLMERPELLGAVARDFELAGLCYDHRDGPGPGPVLVLARPEPGAERGAVLLEELPDADVDAYRRAHGLDGPGTLLLPVVEDRADRLRLLGTTLEPLPGDGHSWLTWHWLVEAPLVENYQLWEELGVPDEDRRWSRTRQLGHGVAPSSRWEPGTIVRDGFPVLFAEGALDPEIPWARLGADVEPGEPLALELWARLGTAHPELGLQNALLPVGPDGARPTAPPESGVEERAAGPVDARGFWRVRALTVPAPGPPVR